MKDYKTKYEKAIEQAKKELQTCGSLDCDAARQIFRFFPELKKSEDERIKKEIIQFLQLPHPQFVGKRNQEKWIAWLKKQGEKVDVIKNFNTEFERQISHLIASTINKEHEYNEGFVKWAANALLNYAKHELEEQVEHKPQDKPALEVWKDMRLEVYQQASGNRHEPNYSDDSTKMFSLTDIDEIIDKIDEKQGEQNNKHLYDVIIALWDLLDKIDTFSDLQIDDTNPDNPFKKIEYIAQERHKFVKSDGYNLYIQGEQITDFKQSKQKPADKCIGCNNFKGCITCTDGDQYAHITEQKPTDNLEPKFKVGDWVVRNCKNNDTVIHKVVNIRLINDNCEIYGYELDDFTYVSGSFENEYRLWTIQDAKDGDVLAFDSEYKGNRMVQVGIIKKYVGKHGGCSNTFNIYVGVNWDNNLQIDEYMGCSDIRPATKEQRDLLFVKLKEAGYEWDVEKKELKKIEQKSTWSEEDEHILEAIIKEIEANKTAGPEYDEKVYDMFLSWLKSLKVRIQHQHKQEWSEKDEKLIEDTCHLINTLASGYGEKVTEPITLSGTQMIASIKNRLRALVDNRPQNNWKPSDEQMDALNLAIGEANSVDTAAGDEAAEILTSLYEQLKKLREE